MGKYRDIFVVEPTSGVTEEDLELVNSVAFSLNDSMRHYDSLPHYMDIRRFIDDNRNVLGKDAYKIILSTILKQGYFNPDTQRPNEILNWVDPEDRKQIRVILYPGTHGDLENLKLHDATHIMIIEIDHEQEKAFRIAKKHKNMPSFYQPACSKEVSLLYIESLLIDAGMCHFFGISDAAPLHKMKQAISLEKVEYLREIKAEGTIEGLELSEGAFTLVNKVIDLLADTTPYVSFLSIFTIYALDIENDREINRIQKYFMDYCKLWLGFQKWYFSKHGRVFSETEDLHSVFLTLFAHNKYKGQISINDAVSELNETIGNIDIASKKESEVIGWEKRYAFMIIRNIPGDPKLRIQMETLFSGQLHQAKWRIIHWSRITDFRKILTYIEVVPFLIS